MNETACKDVATLDEKGQSVVEYAIVTAFCVLVLIEATIWVLDAMSEFYTDLTRVICLPLP